MGSKRKLLWPGLTIIIPILFLIALIISFLKPHSSNVQIINKFEDDIVLQAKNSMLGKDNNLKIIEEFSNSEDLTSDSLTIENKLKLIDEFKNKNGYSSGKLIDSAGDCITTTKKIYKVDKEEPFINAMKGKSTASDPLVNSGSGVVSISYTVPITRDGKVLGALSFSKILMNII